MGKERERKKEREWWYIREVRNQKNKWKGKKKEGKKGR